MSFQPRIIRKNKNTARPLVLAPLTPIETVIIPPITTTTTIESELSNPSTLSFLLPRSIAKRKVIGSKLSTVTKESIEVEQPIIASTSNLLENVNDNNNDDENIKLELILNSLELTFSDWGLSNHFKLLEKLRTSKDGYVHFQFILQNSPPVNALTKIQVDLQKALKLRKSNLLELSPTGFQVRRIHPPDFETLSKLKGDDWQDMTLYLENLPSVPGVLQTTHTLSSHLSSLFSTSIQKIVLPPLYDPAHPTPSTLGSTSSSYSSSSTTSAQLDQSGVVTQDEAFLSGKKRGKTLNLPVGGGPFKGFAFIVVGRKEDAETILKKWKWEKGTEDVKGGKGKEVEDMNVDESEVESDYEKLARESGMRAISYAKFLDFKIEYLEYQRALLSLQSHSESNNYNYNDYNNTTSTTNSWKSDHPSSSSNYNYQSNYNNDSHLSSNRKRDRFESNNSDHPNAYNNKNKRVRDTSPDYTLGGTSSSLPELISEGGGGQQQDILGAFPQGCVLWIRNLYERTTRGGLKALLAGILDNKEEGSGKGIQYVDYDKGLDTCHARFSSPHHANIIIDHFATTSFYHLTPSFLSLKPSPSNPERKSISIQLLSGDRERIYWETLPENTRREARKLFMSIPVAVGLAQIKNKKKRKEEGNVLFELEKMDLEIEKVLESKKVKEKLIPSVGLLEERVEEVVKPRKKPSKF